MIFSFFPALEKITNVSDIISAASFRIWKHQPLAGTVTLSLLGVKVKALEVTEFWQMPHKRAWGQARPACTLQREAEVHGEGLGDLSPPVTSACILDTLLELDVGEVHPQLLSPLLVVSSLGQHQYKSSVLQKARADLHPGPAVGHGPFPRAPSPAFTPPFTEPISFIAVAILHQVYVALVSWTLAQSYPTRAETSTRWLPAPQQLGVNTGVGAGSSPFHSTIIRLWLILPYDTMPQDISLPSYFKSLVHFFSKQRL